jgi:hypothetical protein
MSPDQTAMIQALMGGVAQPGVMQSGQNPMTQYGQSFLTGNPTVPGGMLGANPYQSVNPNMPAQQPAQMGGGGQMNPMQMPGNQQLMQPMQAFPGTGGNPSWGQWDGGGGGGQGQ